MSEVVVVTAKSFPDPDTLPLISDVQYREPYSSAGMNRKLRGIINEGFYTGFTPSPGDGLNLLISSGENGGSASFDVGARYQLTVRQQSDITIAMTAGTAMRVVLEVRYVLGQETYQVNSASSIQSTQIVLLDSATELSDGQLEICTVTIPSGKTQLTSDMIDTSRRVNQTIGVVLSDALDGDRSNVAASEKAVGLLQEGKQPLATNLTSLAATTAAIIAKLIELGATNTVSLAELNYLDGVTSAIQTQLNAKQPLATNLTSLAGTTATIIAKLIELGATTTVSLAELNYLDGVTSAIQTQLNAKAPLASPALTGVPTAPTAAQTVNNTQIATTAFVKAAISALVASSPEALDTLNELAAALGNDPNFSTTMVNALAGKQPLDSTLTALAGKTVSGLLEY
ncbi:TPA: phage tail protein, partial [Enterobacter hormaechei subsp. xiangfangensis]